MPDALSKPAPETSTHFDVLAVPCALDVSMSLQAGLALHREGKLEQAQQTYEQILAVSPSNFDALHFMGVIFYQLGNYPKSVEIIGKALAVDTKQAAAHINLGVALTGLGRIEEALLSFDRAIALKDGSAQAHLHRGNTLMDLQRFDEAVTSHTRAIEIKGDFAQAHLSLGSALKHLGRLEEAAQCFEKAIALKENYAQAFFNRGVVLHEQSRMDAAIASYESAINIVPDYAEAWLNKSLALLSLGEYRAAWPLYEWRWRKERRKLDPNVDMQRQWNGRESLQDKTILIFAEQGLGDSIQFCRFVPALSGLGARVLLQVPRSLLGLVASLQGVTEAIEEGAPVPPFDFHCALMSLPGAFQTDLCSIPLAQGYLSVSPGKYQYWQQRLGLKQAVRIGLVWNGAIGTQRDKDRSLPLGQLLTHLPSQFEYICLQKEIRDSDRGHLAASGIRYFGPEIADFTDTAALCELVDLVISVDTSVAHLAGALGRPTWVLLPYVADWRWLMGREDSPWYKSVRLIRQGVDVNWAEVLRTVFGNLRG